ncbi:hypothetical protein SCWH03_31900 [Streptomyces pacificus]|uniref:Uncharacterized protein n=1 Tax=Streptomyces pacificus TaxID=2705029 RepID=A0A6A0AZB3_9ACTN|nr:hypothetical protein SCWH03_31900 [Streptomyces pacificus]
MIDPFAVLAGTGETGLRNSGLVLSSRGQWMSVLRAILVPRRRPGAADEGARWPRWWSSTMDTG